MALLLCAGALWGWNWWRAAQTAPVRAHLEAGRDFLQQGRRQDAAREWRETVRLDANNLEAWQLLGDWYVSEGDWKAGLDAWQHVERLHPDYPALYINLAKCAARLGDWALTERYTEAGLKRQPDDVGAWRVLAQVLEQRGETDKRLRALQRLAQLTPRDPIVLASLAQALIAANRYDEALPILDRWVQVAPNSATAHALRGAALLNVGSAPHGLNQVETDLLKALQIRPNDYTARLNLGQFYIRSGQPAKAISHLEMLGQMRQANPGYLMDLANAYQQTGQTAKALEARRRFAAIEQINYKIAVLKSRVRNDPQNADLNLQIALLLMQSNNPSGVDTYIQRVLRLRPHDARVQAAAQQLEHRYVTTLQAGLAALKRADYPEAGWRISQALLLRPNDPRTQNAAQLILHGHIPAEAKTNLVLTLDAAVQVNRGTSID